MKLLLSAGALLLLALPAGMFRAQVKTPQSAAAVSSTRYFQLTLNLTFGANGEVQEGTQTITSEFAIRGSIHGSSKARMVSQTPAGSGTGTRYIEVGTKFDANDIRIEGDGIALHFVLSASRPVKMIRYTQSDGKEMEEPIITERNVELDVKLPLDKPRVVFDSSSKALTQLKSQEINTKNDPAAEASAGVPRGDQPMKVEMAVTELK